MRDEVNDHGISDGCDPGMVPTRTGFRAADPWEMPRKPYKQSTALDAACKYLGWQGGTVHQAKAALTAEETRLIRMYNQMDEETDQEVVGRVHNELATVQYLLMALGSPKHRTDPDTSGPYAGRHNN